jgi:glycosyltransferase involved in cell wall biosynthesis
LPSPAEPDIPAHKVEVFGPKRYPYLLVIPVINEGERIRHQLQRIAQGAPPCDVVIADGGSTDRSVAADFLRSIGVRALLVKTGPGKLSAQLRMAYAWALHEGYQGVVTIDGNGKDGVEAIPRFIDKLADGYDYVQGSRYLSGGAARNTPIDRYLAGRLVHAPVLSVAARRWYTDTTNGFRAYSARYLQDERVQPFRAIFDRYSLLFYLTVRASQIGLRTTEIPVRREYPGDEVPTRISGMRSKLQLLAEMFGVALGRYRPPTRPTAA